MTHGTTVRKRRCWRHEWWTLAICHRLVSQHYVGLVLCTGGARRQVGGAGRQRDEREVSVKMHSPARPGNGLVAEQHGIPGVFAQKLAVAVGPHDEVDMIGRSIDPPRADVIQN